MRREKYFKGGTISRLVLAIGTILMAVHIACAEDIPARVAPEDFAIVAWRVPGDVDSLRVVRDCGFNLAGRAVPESLDAVAAAGLKAIVLHERTKLNDGLADRDEASITRDVNAMVKRTGKHPAVFGYWLAAGQGMLLSMKP